MRSVPPGSGPVPSSRPLSARTGPPCREATVTRYPPARPSAAAARVAPAKTSCGPTASSGCRPSKATITTWRSLMRTTLSGPPYGVNDTVPTDSAIRAARQRERVQPVRARRVPRARTQARRSPSSPRHTVPVKMSSRSVEASRAHLGDEPVAQGCPAEVLDQDGGDDARVVVVVRGGGDGCAGHGVEDRTVHRAVRVGVARAGREGGDRVTRPPAHHLDPEEGGEFVRPGSLHGSLKGPGWPRAGAPASAPPSPASACGSPGSACAATRRPRGRPRWAGSR